MGFVKMKIIPPNVKYGEEKLGEAYHSLPKRKAWAGGRMGRMNFEDRVLQFYPQ